MKHPRRGSSKLQLALWLVIIVVAIVAILNWRWIYDSARLLQYQPPANIEQIADATTMNTHARRVFYATQPSIDTAANFRGHCLQQESGGAVLGCYASNRIYIFDVNNDELQGIEEVTGAHEMLHAAFVRLSSEERNEVTELLLEQEQSLQDDSAFRERMAVYDELSETDRVDELHSILATEQGTLSEELERYYGEYFADRQAVTTLYKQYADVFAAVKNEANQLAASLDAQAVAINERSAAYEAANQTLTADIQAFNQQANQPNGFGSEAAFNAARDQLMQRSDALESERQSINAAVDAYNQDKARYEDVAAHLAELNTSIDSSINAPAEVR